MFLLQPSHPIAGEPNTTNRRPLHRLRKQLRCTRHSSYAVYRVLRTPRLVHGLRAPYLGDISKVAKTGRPTALATLSGRCRLSIADLPRRSVGRLLIHLVSSKMLLSTLVGITRARRNP